MGGDFRIGDHTGPGPNLGQTGAALKDRISCPEQGERSGLPAKTQLPESWPSNYAFKSTIHHRGKSANAKRCFCYRFKVFNSAEQEVFCVVLESDAAEQPAWAQEHPKEAASGGRKFSNDGYASDSHSTYGFYDCEPPYEQVREEAKQVLADKRQAINKTTYLRPQPFPGEE